MDWEKIEQSLPKAYAGLVQQIREAHDGAGDNPARAVEKALRETLSELEREFEAAKEEAK